MSHFPSRLGYGLSSIMGVSHKQRERLLATALEHGINHFDVAPYYGSGDAESLLGQFARGRRDRLTIATKTGLVSNVGGSHLKSLRCAARVVFRVAPFLKAGAQSFVANSIQTAYRPEAVRKSLEASLVQLDTDYVDVFHLHDWPGSCALADDVMAELLALKQAGKIRAAGLASSPGDVDILLAADPPIFDVVQFENSLLRPSSDLPRRAGARWVISHRALADTLAASTWLLKSRPGLAQAWRRQLDLNTLPKGLPELLLGWAAAKNPNGTVLFSARTPAHIKALAEVGRQPLLGVEQIDRLERLASGVRSALVHHSSGALRRAG